MVLAGLRFALSLVGMNLRGQPLVGVAMISPSPCKCGQSEDRAECGKFKTTALVRPT